MSPGVIAGVAVGGAAVAAVALGFGGAKLFGGAAAAANAPFGGGAQGPVDVCFFSFLSCFSIHFFVLFCLLDV